MMPMCQEALVFLKNVLNSAEAPDDDVRVRFCCRIWQVLLGGPKVRGHVPGAVTARDKAEGVDRRPISTSRPEDQSD